MNSLPIPISAHPLRRSPRRSILPSHPSRGATLSRVCGRLVRSRASNPVNGVRFSTDAPSLIDRRVNSAQRVDAGRAQAGSVGLHAVPVLDIRSVSCISNFSHLSCLKNERLCANRALREFFEASNSDAFLYAHRRSNCVPIKFKT